MFGFVLLFLWVAHASWTITKSFTSVAYKNGKFFTKLQVCKLWNIVSMSWVEFKYIFPGNSMDQWWYVDGFVKQNSNVFYLGRVEYYQNKNHVVEHQLFIYDCKTKKSSIIWTWIIFTWVMQYPWDSNLFVRYVDMSSKTALFELWYEWPAQYYIVDLILWKIGHFNPKTFLWQSNIDKIISKKLRDSWEKPQRDTLDSTCINCWGYESQLIYSIWNAYSAPDWKLSSQIKIYTKWNQDKPYTAIPVTINMKKKTISVRQFSTSTSIRSQLFD